MIAARTLLNGAPPLAWRKSGGRNDCRRRRNNPVDEDVLRDASAQRNAADFVRRLEHFLDRPGARSVETPVYAKIDTADRVLEYRIRHRCVTSLVTHAEGPVIIHGHAI